MRKIELPPALTGLRLAAGEVFAAACAGARGDAADGTLVWADRADLFDCALIVRPEAPLAEALWLAYAGMVGLADALGAVLPPQLPITFAWPDRFDANGAPVGGARLAWGEVSPEGVPAWLVFAVTLRLLGDLADDSPGRRTDRTNLQEEGAGALESHELIEIYSRYLLAWIARWQDEGNGPVRAAWLARANGWREAQFTDPARTRIYGIAEDGSADIEQSGVRTRQPLAAALARPSWTI
jgi:BirA family transcriptional regulator, biotin operon repressor / biotin---[acetyl-CoA-carboxylase] ligase